MSVMNHHPSSESSLFPEQVGMCASSHQDKLISGNFVDQKPIRGDMALPRTFILPNQGMVTIPLIKSLSMYQCFNHLLKLGETFIAPLHTFDIFFELRGAMYGSH